MMKKAAINGMGRIGRATLKILMETEDLELVAVNDVAPLENIAYLLSHDTVYGRYDKPVEVREGTLTVAGRAIRVLSEKDPAKLPWREMGVELVFECTGIFDTREDLEKHLQAGAARVILSAPAKGKDVETVVYGSSEGGSRPAVVSCASCTTNAITPVVEVVARRIGIKKAVMTTVHAYTSTQRIVDSPSKKMRRGRAGAANLVPTSTGAAIATTKVLSGIAGKFDGLAMRVPIACGSIADLVFVTEKPTSVEEITRIFREEAATDRYRGVLGVTDDPVVSSDIIRDPRAVVVDLDLTRVVDGDLVKIFGWYDNEWGYAAQMVREARGFSES